MCIGFCPGYRCFVHILYFHYIIIWQSLNSSYSHPDFLTWHSIARLPRFSIRCRTANIASATPLSIWDKSKLCVPKPSLNNHFTHIQSISALSICNPHNPGCLTHQSIGTIRLYLHSVDILSCSYTLSIILITCQHLLFPNTSTHPLESHPFPLSLLSSFVITLLFSTSFLPINCVNNHLALHPQRQTCAFLHSAAYQNIPSIFP